MAAVQWLREMLEANVVWKTCHVHELTYSSLAATTCSHCRAQNDQVAAFRLEMGVTKQTARACYTLEAASSDFQLDCSIPLSLCPLCQPEVLEVMDEDNNLATHVQDSLIDLFLHPLASVIMDYLYKATVRCPFH